MSTRSNILVTDGNENLLFYRHSDGYPSGQFTLLRFMQEIKDGKIRNNVNQSAGWLVVWGNEEYADSRKEFPDSSGWKVGAYEPTDMYGGDIEYFYICNIKSLEIEVYKAHFGVAQEGIKNLKERKYIRKAVEQGWLTKIATVTNFKDEKKFAALDKIDGGKYKTSSSPKAQTLLGGKKKQGWFKEPIRHKIAALKGRRR
jgi:hypothetical protein